MLEEHLQYLSDRVRLERFRHAISKAVTEGDIVVDLGCGTGILGLYSLQAGASHVIAVDSGPIIEVARETFQRAGLAGSLEFHNECSYRLNLPVRADLVICDHVGYFGFDYGIIDLLTDARKRFLKPAGAVLPARIRLMLGAVQSVNACRKVSGWHTESIPREFHWLSAYRVNAKHAIALSADDLLGRPCELGTIDLKVDNPEFFCWTTELTVQKQGILQGIGGWFECELAGDVWMTNSPVSADAIDRAQAFFPINESVPVCEGDEIRVTLAARPVDNVISWTVELPRTGRRFSHSTWLGLVVGPGDIDHANQNRTPRVSRIGRARAIILSYCDGRRSAREIRDRVLQEHPDLLPSRSEMIRFVSEVLARDTEQ